MTVIILLTVAIPALVLREVSHNFSALPTRAGAWLFMAFALTVLAYAGFDRVLVGLTYSVAMTLFVLACFLPIRRRYREHPFTTYTTIVYVLGTVASIAVRIA